MNKKTNTPDLNAISDDFQDYSNFDWGAAGVSDNPTPNTSSQSQPTNTFTPGSSDDYRTTVSNNSPTADHFQKAMLDILDTAVAGSDEPQANPQPFVNTNDNGSIDSIVVPPKQVQTQNNQNVQNPSEGDTFENIEDNVPADLGNNQNNPNSAKVSNQPGPQDRSVNDIALEFIKEMDLLRLPENSNFTELTPEAVQYYKEQTEFAKREEALNFLRNNVSHDPHMTQLFDYAYTGGDYADIPRMRQLIDTEIDYKSLDLSDSEIQKEIVGMFLTEGLDPSNLQHSRLIDNIPNQVKNYESQLKLKDEAELARNYFVEKAQEKQYHERLRVQQQIENAERSAYQQEEMDRNWNKQFRQVLSDSQWSQDRKNAIIHEAREVVTLPDGGQVPMWQYKQQVIMDNPELFHVFLDFTSKLDLNTGRFTDYGSSKASSETVAQVLERIANKQNGSNRDGTGTTILNDPNKQFTPPTIDASNDNWFF